MTSLNCHKNDGIRIAMILIGNDPLKEAKDCGISDIDMKMRAGIAHRLNFS